MVNILRAVMVVAGIIIVYGIGYAFIQLVNGILYQIFIHPERTCVIVLSILGIWAGIEYIIKRINNSKV